MTTTLADRNLEEQIFQLQKLELDPLVKHVVDEATQLLAEGRHLEAGALIEKAEAMRTAPGEGEAQPVRPDSRGSADLAGSEASGEQVVIQLASDLANGIANGIAKVLAGSIRNLQEHIVGETHRVHSSFNEKFEKLQATVERLLPLNEWIEQIAETVAEQRSAGLAMEQKHEQLSAATTSLQGVSAQHETAITALHGQMQDLSASVSGRIDTISTKLNLHDQELSGLQSTVSDLSPRVANLVERLDRQAGVIRSLHEAEAHREATLDQLIEALARLKPSHPPEAISEGQL